MGKVPVTSGAAGTGGTPTEQYFDRLISDKGTLYKIAKNAYGYGNGDTPNVADLQVNNSVFEQEIFQQFSDQLQLFRTDANGNIEYNISKDTPPAQISKIKVALGIGSDGDKQAIYNMLVNGKATKLISIVNPQNSKNIKDMDFNSLALQKALFKKLSPDEQKYATQYQQALSMARAVTLMADQHGNAPNRLGKVAIADGDVELTPENMKFVGAMLSKSGLDNIYSPVNVQNWLVEQNAANTVYKKDGQINTEQEERVMISATGRNALLAEGKATEDDLIAIGNKKGVDPRTNPIVPKQYPAPRQQKPIPPKPSKPTTPTGPQNTNIAPNATQQQQQPKPVQSRPHIATRAEINEAYRQEARNKQN